MKIKTHAQSLLVQEFDIYCAKLREDGYNISNTLAFENEMFTAQILLKSKGLSHTEIMNGIVGGQYDGGIDGMYIFLEGDLIDSAADLQDLVDGRALTRASSQAKLEVVIFQAKRGSALSSDVPRKIKDELVSFLDFESAEEYYENLPIRRSQELKDRFKQLMDLVRDLRISGQNIEFKMYGCGGVDGEYEGEARDYAVEAENVVRKHFNKATATFFHYGPEELLDIWQNDDDRTAILRVKQNVEVDGQYVMICTLEDYFNFITDPDGNLRIALFDGNVRGFLGSKIEVNSNIIGSLDSFANDNIQFWWMNNGITVTCSKTPSKTAADWTIEDVQIVNGLQTSHMIYDHARRVQNSGTGSLDSLRDNLVTVKVISSSDPDTLSRIIQATNSQSPVRKASLRATDKVQRRIEKYFDSSNESQLVYDRRRGNAATQGVLAERVVQIEELSQALLSIFLLRPNDARARPGTAIDNDSVYSKLFPDKGTSLDQYLWAATLYKQCVKALRGTFLRDELNDTLFYVLSLISLKSSSVGRDQIFIELGKSPKLAKDISLQPDFSLTYSDEFILSVANEVFYCLEDFTEQQGMTRAKAAKGKEFRLNLLSRVYDGRTAVSKVLQIN